MRRLVEQRSASSKLKALPPNCPPREVCERLLASHYIAPDSKGSREGNPSPVMRNCRRVFQRFPLGLSQLLHSDDPPSFSFRDQRQSINSLINGQQVRTTGSRAL
jgi:hypothetical protein